MWKEDFQRNLPPAPALTKPRPQPSAPPSSSLSREDRVSREKIGQATPGPIETGEPSTMPQTSISPKYAEPDVLATLVRNATTPPRIHKSVPTSSRSTKSEAQSATRATPRKQVASQEATGEKKTPRRATSARRLRPTGATSASARSSGRKNPANSSRRSESGESSERIVWPTDAEYSSRFDTQSSLNSPPESTYGAGLTSRDPHLAEERKPYGSHLRTAGNYSNIVHPFGSAVPRFEAWDPRRASFGGGASSGGDGHPPGCGTGSRFMRSSSSAPSLSNQQPEWDSTPSYSRPNALQGLRLYKANEAWARDEILYQMRGGRSSNYWSDYHGMFDVPGFSQLSPNRVFNWELRKTDYLGRWNNKFVETGSQLGGMRESGVGGYDRFDGNPFT